MKMADKIQKQISKKKEDVSLLEVEISKLQSKIIEANGVITGLDTALQLIPKEPSANNFQRDISNLRSGSDVEKAYLYISERGASVRIEDILEGIGKENTKKTRQALAGQLSYNFRDGRIFTRPAPNTFGLQQWPGSQGSIVVDQNETDDFDLPDDFGQ